MLYTFGSALDFGGQVWLHMLIATSVILIVNRRPYVSAVDQEVELFALLALAGVAHISSIFRAGQEWEPKYIALSGVLFLLPLFTFIFRTVYEKRQFEKEMARLTAMRSMSGQELPSPTAGRCSRCRRTKTSVKALRRDAAAEQPLPETIGSGVHTAEDQRNGADSPRSPECVESPSALVADFLEAEQNLVKRSV